MMQSGKCPKCNSSEVYFKPYALNNVDYICTECGYFETYITDQDTLKKIPLGDWKKAK